MTGIGQAASGLTISPAELAFTEPVIGSPSPPQLATITNTSKAPADGLALFDDRAVQSDAKHLRHQSRRGSKLRDGDCVHPDSRWGCDWHVDRVVQFDRQSRSVCTYRDWRRGWDRADSAVAAEVLRNRSGNCQQCAACDGDELRRGESCRILESAHLQWIPGYRHHLRLAPRAGCKLHGDGYLCARKCRPADRVSDN